MGEIAQLTGRWYTENMNDFKFSHALGQNFILDPAIIRRLADAACVEAGQNILEIGPGSGSLTAEMLDRGAKVAAIEADERLREPLKIRLGREDVVHFADAMKVDFDKFVAERFGGEPFRVVANLPYYIAIDVVRRFFRMENKPTDIVVMVQKECAQRLMAPMGCKEYAAASAECQYFGVCRSLLDLPPEAFTPRPHVYSTLMRISRRPFPEAARDEDMMRRVIGAAFAMRRKTLLNNLTKSFSVGRDVAAGWMENAGLSLDVRGEAVPLEGLARLADSISRHA